MKSKNLNYINNEGKFEIVSNDGKDSKNYSIKDFIKSKQGSLKTEDMDNHRGHRILIVKSENVNDEDVYPVKSQVIENNNGVTHSIIYLLTKEEVENLTKPKKQRPQIVQDLEQHFPITKPIIYKLDSKEEESHKMERDSTQERKLKITTLQEIDVFKRSLVVNDKIQGLKKQQTIPQTIQFFNNGNQILITDKHPKFKEIKEKEIEAQKAKEQRSDVKINMLYIYFLQKNITDLKTKSKITKEEEDVLEEKMSKVIGVQATLELYKEYKKLKESLKDSEYSYELFEKALIENNNLSKIKQSIKPTIKLLEEYFKNDIEKIYDKMDNLVIPEALNKIKTSTLKQGK